MYAVFRDFTYYLIKNAVSAKARSGTKKRANADPCISFASLVFLFYDVGNIDKSTLRGICHA